MHQHFARSCIVFGVLKNSQNPIKIGNFRTFFGVLSNIFRLNRLFSFVFSANFRFQNNFQTKIIPKTIPIFIAVFKKSNAKRHLFSVAMIPNEIRFIKQNYTLNYLSILGKNCRYINVPYFIAIRCCFCSTGQR